MNNQLTTEQKLQLFERGRYDHFTPPPAGTFTDWVAADWVNWIDKHGQWEKTNQKGKDEKSQTTK